MEDFFFDYESITKHIGKLNSNSGSGPDGLTPQCIKKGGKFIKDALSDIYNHMWKEGYSPCQMRQAWIAPG